MIEEGFVIEQFQVRFLLLSYSFEVSCFLLLQIRFDVSDEYLHHILPSLPLSPPLPNPLFFPRFISMWKVSTETWMPLLLLFNSRTVNQSARFSLKIETRWCSSLPPSFLSLLLLKNSNEKKAKTKIKMKKITPVNPCERNMASLASRSKTVLPNIYSRINLILSFYFFSLSFSLSPSLSFSLREI